MDYCKINTSITLLTLRLLKIEIKHYMLQLTDIFNWNVVENLWFNRSKSVHFQIVIYFDPSKTIIHQDDKSSIVTKDIQTI